MNPLLIWAGSPLQTVQDLGMVVGGMEEQLFERLCSRSTNVVTLFRYRSSFLAALHCGPFASSWLKMATEKGSRQMNDLAQVKDWMAIPKLQNIVNKAPEETEIVAARLESGIIMLIEGHHRVIAKILNPAMPTRFHLALTELCEDDQRFYESWNV
ncbi:hypothetical protein IPJ72_04430 [Candidatus Peregrinibacteria bacterium]|nr:MAG: hypothetical protein IPJ72_04430 [Candidatus Peregrinibacteria bacterium]